jgi:hypothetical protein
VQLIEVSIIGVRSAVITLQAPGTPMQISLFPMLHLGTPDYYQSVTARLAACDVIIAEGISGQSVIARALTLAYRLPARSRRLALTVQHIDCASLGVPVVRPDLTAPQFRALWRTIPALQRLTVWCLVPIFAVSFALLGTRRTLSRHVATEDLPSSLDGLARQAMPKLIAGVLDHRDDLLVACLDSIHEQRHAEDVNVGVVYGAGHMPAVAHAMFRRHGYRPSAAEWISVFDF